MQEHKKFAENQSARAVKINIYKDDATLLRDSAIAGRVYWLM